MAYPEGRSRVRMALFIHSSYYLEAHFLLTIAMLSSVPKSMVGSTGA
jgi:hypothetical protein